MTKFRFAPVVAVVCAVFGSAGVTNAQGIVTRWTFNSNPPDADTTTGTLVPSVGTGTAATIGGATQTFAGGTVNFGSTDTTAADNSGWNLAGYPTQSTNSGTAGAQYTVSTTGQSNLVFRFDMRHSNSSSRFLRVEYTTNGTTWTPAQTFEAGAGGDLWYNNRTADLSDVAAANNNPNFAARVVTIFDPANNTTYTGTAGNYATSGTMRYDAVTLSSAFVWAGGTGTGLDVAANFAGGAAPGATGTVLLGAAGGANTTVSTAAAETTLDQLIFRANAPAYTVSGAANLTLNAGLVNNSTAAHVVSAPVLFGNQNSVYNAGRVTFTSDVRFTNGLVLQGTGATTLNGTILGTSTGTLTVASGSTLSGIGTSNRPVTVAAGGAIRGGDGTGSSAERVGTLTVTGNVTINSTATANGILRVEASRNTGTTQVGNSNADSSVLSVTGGTLHFVPDPGTKFTIDVVSGTNPLVEGETYTIQLAGVDAATNLQLNGSSIGGNQTIAATNYTLTSAQFSFSNVSLTTNSSGTALFVTFTAAPVPEPTTVLALAAGAMAVGRAVRRTRSREFA